MNNLMVFKNQDFGEVRAIEIENETWFIGKDVAIALGYKDTADALRRHVDEDDKLTRRFTMSGQNRNMYVINESGLYSLILSSKLESAKKFKRWVTSEVLPSIRKHGMYTMDYLLENPDLAISALTALKEERDKRLLLQQQMEKDKPKVEFAEQILISEDTITVEELAKLVKNNGYDIGRTRMFKWLRENKYLNKTGENKNIPTQFSMDKGYFVLKEYPYVDCYGNVRLGRQARVTPEGQKHIIKKILKAENYAIACSVKQ